MGPLLLWVIILTTLCAYAAIQTKPNVPDNLYNLHSQQEGLAVNPVHNGGLQIYSRCVLPNTVAISFDDGPGPFSQQLLDILARMNVTASFFLIGKYVNRSNADCASVRRMIRQGHQIGSHTYNHVSLGRISNLETLKQELHQTRQVIHSCTGLTVRYLRPPFGELPKPDWEKVIADKGYRTVLWSADSRDWDVKPYIPKVMDNLMKNNFETDKRSWILLQHEVLQDTVNAQERFLGRLRTLGYQFVTVAACLGFADEDAYEEDFDMIQQCMGKSTKKVTSASMKLLPTLQVLIAIILVAFA